MIEIWIKSQDYAWRYTSVFKVLENYPGEHSAFVWILGEWK